MSEGRRVGWRLISLHTLACLGTVLLFLAPVLVTWALRVNALVGIERAPQSLGLVPPRHRHRHRQPAGPGRQPGLRADARLYARILLGRSASGST